VAAQAPVELAPQPAVAPATTAPPRRERRSGRSRSASAEIEASEESSALGGFSFGMGGGDDEDDSRSAAKKAKPSNDPEESISAGSMRVTLDDPSETQTPSSEFGEDLRERRQEQRRTIDTEDPFDEP
jgi:hypothetical protein